jgi:hypothetical protein
MIDSGIPAHDRARFWRDSVARDPNLVSLYPAAGFLELARTYGR